MLWCLAGRQKVRLSACVSVSTGLQACLPCMHAITNERTKVIVILLSYTVTDWFIAVMVITTVILVLILVAVIAVIIKKIHGMICCIYWSTANFTGNVGNIVFLSAAYITLHIEVRRYNKYCISNVIQMIKTYSEVIDSLNL